MRNFDYVVIGAGQGSSLARLLAENGAKVALIEKAFVGGTCTNVGCTPTKAHIAAAKIACEVRSSARFGVQASLERVDLALTVKRTRTIVEEFRKESEEKLLNLENLSLVYGVARFSDKGEVEIDLCDGKKESVTGEKYIVAVGAKASIPPVDGLESVPFLTNKEILEIEEVPVSLLILGGGYIACEFAQMFARFGSRVTIIQNKDALLPREDKDIADAVHQVLEESGIEVILGQEVGSVRRVSDGIEARWGGQKRNFSHILVATGQEPQNKTLNLDSVGVELTESGHIKTDDYLKTSNPRIFALGDCKGGPAFTHMAFDDGRILLDGLLYQKWRSIKDRPVPYTVFIDPQLGRIGMTEKEAVESGKKFDVASLAMKDTARGVETGQSQGLWKVLVERETGLILGGAFLSGEGGETMAVVEMAMIAKMPYSMLRDGIFAHPTWAEGLNNLFIGFDRQKESQES